MTTDTTDPTMERGLIGFGLAPDPNGWRRTAVDAGTQMAGDDALMEFTAYYERDHEVLEVTYYVVVVPRGTDAEDATEWGVDEMVHYCHVDADGENRECGHEDYSYEGGYPLSIDSLDKACRIARNMAMQDESWKLGDSGLPCSV